MEFNIQLENKGFSQDEFSDIKMCLETLLSVRAGSQPLDRDLGIDLDGIAGYPLNVAKNMLAMEIIEKVNVYEPRVKVKSVDVKTGEDGQMIPHVFLAKREG